MWHLTPTTKENVFSRLLLRYFVCYTTGFALSAWLTRCGISLFIPPSATLLGPLPVLLALLAVFLTVANLYLVLLTMGKGLLDAALFLRLVHLTSLAQIGFIIFNACFLLLALCVLLFLITATRTCLCARQTGRRDLRFIFSRDFGIFLPDALCFVLLALFAYLLWQRLLAVLPLC